MLVVHPLEVGLSLREDLEVEGQLGVGSEAAVILSEDCFLLWKLAFCILYLKGTVYDDLEIALRAENFLLTDLVELTAQKTGIYLQDWTTSWEGELSKLFQIAVISLDAQDVDDHSFLLGKLCGFGVELGAIETNICFSVSAEDNLGAFSPCWGKLNGSN